MCCCSIWRWTACGRFGDRPRATIPVLRRGRAMRAIYAVAAALGLTAGTGAAQEPADSARARADSTPTAAPRQLAITGFAEGSSAYTTRGDGDVIVGRLY